MTQQEWGRRRVIEASLVVCGGVALAAIYHYAMGVYFGAGYPAMTFLFIPGDRFNDFHWTFLHTKRLNPYFEPLVFFPSNYFPFTHLFLLPLTWIGEGWAFLLAMGTFVVGTAAYFRRRFRAFTTDVTESSLWTLCIVMVSYPVLLTLDRGNIEGLMFLMMLLGLLAFRKERYVLAALLLALPTAMKIYPGVMFGLFVIHRRYRALAIGVATVIALNVIALMMFDGGFFTNLDRLLTVIGGVQGKTLVNINLIRKGTSLLGALRTIVFLVDPQLFFAPQFAAALGKLYTQISVVMLAGTGVYLLRFKTQLWEQVTLFVGLMLLVPGISYDYKLIHVLLCLDLFLASDAVEGSLGWVRTILLALLLVPKEYGVLFADVTTQVVTNPVLLLILMGTIVFQRRERRPLFARSEAQHA